MTMRSAPAAMAASISVAGPALVDWRIIEVESTKLRENGIDPQFEFSPVLE